MTSDEVVEQVALPKTVQRALERLRHEGAYLRVRQPAPFQKREYVIVVPDESALMGRREHAASESLVETLATRGLLDMRPMLQFWERGVTEVQCYATADA